MWPFILAGNAAARPSGPVLSLDGDRLVVPPGVELSPEAAARRGKP
jgi:hypothetical protein